MALVMSEGSLCNSRELVGVAGERQEAVADQVDRGLVAGAEQENNVGGQLLVGELAPLLLGLHQLAGQVLAGLAPAQLEQRAEILGLHQAAGVGLVDLGAGQRHGIEQPTAGARAHVEDLVLLLGNAQHLADHRHRQTEGEVGDQVHVPALGDAIERLHRRSPGCAGACPRPGGP